MNKEINLEHVIQEIELNNMNSPSEIIEHDLNTSQSVFIIPEINDVYTNNSYTNKKLLVLQGDSSDPSLQSQWFINVSDSSSWVVEWSDRSDSPLLIETKSNISGKNIDTEVDSILSLDGLLNLTLIDLKKIPESHLLKIIYTLENEISLKKAYLKRLECEKEDLKSDSEAMIEMAGEICRGIEQLRREKKANLSGKISLFTHKPITHNENFISNSKEALYTKKSWFGFWS